MVFRAGLAFLKDTVLLCHSATRIPPKDKIVCLEKPKPPAETIADKRII